MKQYLVMLSRTRSDVPVQLCSTLEDAEYVARCHNGRLTEAEKEIVGDDGSDPVCMKVVTFGECSVPESVETVLDFTRGSR